MAHPPKLEEAPLRAGRGRDPEQVLVELEERHAALCAELQEVERQLRELRTAADLCPLCGGSGQRWVRGGLYGETQLRPCSCQDAE